MEREGISGKGRWLADPISRRYFWGKTGREEKKEKGHKRATSVMNNHWEEKVLVASYHISNLPRRGKPGAGRLKEN